MSGAYPHFRASYTHEELVESFFLTPADLELVFGCRTDVNRCGMALLLKALDYLGYVPDGLEEVPLEVRSFITSQLGLLWDYSEPYVWESRTRDQHLSLIRRHTGWRPPDAFDKEELEHGLLATSTRKTTLSVRSYGIKRLAHAVHITLQESLLWGRELLQLLL